MMGQWRRLRRSMFLWLCGWSSITATTSNPCRGGIELVEPILQILHLSWRRLGADDEFTSTHCVIPRCQLTDRAPAASSHPELAEMVIKMLVQHHAPASPGNAAKDTARWPRRRRSPISKPVNQLA